MLINNHKLSPKIGSVSAEKTISKQELPVLSEVKKRNYASKVARMPLRIFRAAIGVNSIKVAPSPALAEIIPNTLSYSTFSQSQHPSTGPLKSLNAVQNSLAPLPVITASEPDAGPVINRKNEIESQQISKFCEGLMNELRHAETIIDNNIDSKISLTLRKKLLQEISQIRHHLTNCCKLENADSENVHQFVRDNFSEIATITKKMSKCFPRSALVTNKSRNYIPEGTLNQLSHFFDDFHSLTKEVKRHHYDRAAALRLDAYADQEYKNLVALVPALALQRKGSDLIFTKEIMASVLAGIDESHILTTGGSLSYTYTRLKRLFADLDSSACAFEMTSHGISTGCGFKFGNFFRSTGEKSSAVSLQAIAKASFSTGDFINHKNWKEYFKAEAIYQSGKQMHLRYSGKADGVGTKIKQASYSVINYIARDLVGIKHSQRTTIPHINQRKRCKGINNADRMITAALKLQTRLHSAPVTDANCTLSDIVKKAYPRIEDTLSDTGIGVQRNKIFESFDHDLDDTIYSPVADLVSLAEPVTSIERGKSGPGGVSRWDINVKLEAANDLMQGNDLADSKIRLGAKAGVEINSARLTMQLLHLKPIHDQLDPGYNRDINKSRSLLAQLQEPKQGLYQSTILRAKIGNDLPKEADNSSLSKVMQTQLNNKFNDQFIALDGLRAMYLKLSKLSSLAKSFSSKNYRQSNQLSYEEFQESRKEFIRTIFGIDNDTEDKDEKKFIKNLEKKPEFFMTKAYDALSTRLGYIGIDIYDGKHWMHKHQQQVFSEDSNTIVAKRRTIDLMFQSLRNVMDGVFMPIDKETLLRGAAVRASCKVVSSSHTIKGQVRVGLDINPVREIPGNDLNPSDLADESGHDAHENGTFSGWITGGTLGGGVKGSFARVDNYEHYNPIRQGIFHHWKMSGSADGLTSLAVKHLVEGGLKVGKYFGSLEKNEQVRAKLGLEKSDAANDERMASSVHSTHDNDKGFIEDAILLGKRTVLSEYTGEFEMFISNKIPPSFDGHKYESTRQFLRFISRDTQRIGLTVGAPLHYAGIPVTPSVSAHRVCADGNVLFESLGANLSYQVLCFGEMQGVLDCSINQKTIDSTPSITALDSTKLSAQCDFEKMQKLFLNQPQPYSQTVDSRFKLHKFFGTNEAILGLVEKFEQYSEGRRIVPEPTDISDTNCAVRGEKNEALRSEFDFFDDCPVYWHIIKTMETARKYAPGTEVGPFKHADAVNKAFLENLVHDPRPAKLRSDDDLDEIAALQRVKKYFKTGEGKNASSEDRMKYYMTNVDGKIVFQIYCNILSKYEKINRALYNSNRTE